MSTPVLGLRGPTVVPRTWAGPASAALVAAGAVLLGCALLTVTIPAASAPEAALPVLAVVVGGGLVLLLRRAWLLPAWAALTWSAVGAHWFGGLPSPVELGGAGLLAVGLWMRRDDVEHLRRIALLMTLIGLPWLATALLVPTGPVVPRALVHDLPLIAVVALACRGRDDARRVLAALVGLGVVLGVGAVWSVRVGPTELFPLNGSSAVFEYEAPRAAGPFGEANFFALSLVVLVPAALMLLTGRPWERALGAVGAVTLVAGVLATGSRAALVAAAVALVGTAVLQRNRRMLLYAALAALVSLPFFGDQLSGAGSRSTSGRQAEAQIAVAMAGDHPVVGVGPGRYPELYRDYARQVGSDPRSDREPHSLPLEILAEQGLVGVLGWLLAAGVLVGIVVRGKLLAHVEGRTLVLSLATFSAGVLFLHGSQLRLLWILVGLTLACARPLRSRGRVAC